MKKNYFTPAIKVVNINTSSIMDEGFTPSSGVETPPITDEPLF